MEISHLFVDLLLLHKRLPHDCSHTILVFGAGCAFVSVLLAILDLCTKYVRGTSFLGNEYPRWWSYFGVPIFWAIAAAITGMIGFSLDVIQPTIAGCIGVALSWNLLMTALTGKEETDLEDGEEADGAGP